MGLDAARLKTNNSVGFLEMLSLAAQMDYLYLEDVDYSGEINPFLPSKYTDYLASGSKIIAMVKPGSPLSTMSDKQLIKTFLLDDAFVQSIRKRRDCTSSIKKVRVAKK